MQPGAVRRAQLAADVVQPADRARLHPGARHPRRVRATRRTSSTSPAPGTPAPTSTSFATLTKRRRRGRARRVGPGEAEGSLARTPTHCRGTAALLSTAGNLVFQGTADGRFVAYRASDGEQLWEGHAGTGVIAAPVTYLLDGKQYVSVLAGWGGAFGLVSGSVTHDSGGDGKGRLLTFALGTGENPPTQVVLDRITAPGEVFDGERIFHKYCAACHGGGAVAMVGMKDLRKSSPETKSRLRRHRPARRAARRRHAAVLGVPERGRRREAARLPRPPRRRDRRQLGRRCGEQRRAAPRRSAGSRGMAGQLDAASSASLTSCARAPLLGSHRLEPRSGSRPCSCRQCGRARARERSV